MIECTPIEPLEANLSAFLSANTWKNLIPLAFIYNILRYFFLFKNLYINFGLTLSIKGGNMHRSLVSPLV